MPSMDERQMTLSGERQRELLLAKVSTVMCCLRHKHDCTALRLPCSLYDAQVSDPAVQMTLEGCRLQSSVPAGLGQRRRAHQMGMWWWPASWGAWSMAGLLPQAGLARWE